ncbi:MAG: MFS transporter [Blastocatellia bacterium]
MKRCPVCQREYPDKSTFCNQDGTKLLPVVQTLQGRLVIRSSDGGEREVALASAIATIGKTPDNLIIITDAAISRKHARIEQREGQCFVKDLGSLNGTFLNGRRLGDEALPLNEGDEITVGRTKIRFHLVEDISRMQTVESPKLEPPPRTTAVVELAKPPEKPVQPPISPPPLPPPPPAVTNPPISKPAESRFRVAQTGELLPPRPEQKERIVLEGRYELEEKLSQDENGTVYRARRVMLNDMVAVRILRPGLVHDQMAVERFRRQAQVAARIKHPNSVQVFDFGYSAESAAYIVEELLSGYTLRGLIREERGLSLARVVGLFNQVCPAVHVAHLNGIVLRDLKPETIFIEKDAAGNETVKIGGYGLAKVDASFLEGNQGKSLTGPLGIFGLPQYASPEQLTNRPLDARSDVYSLGVILYELLTGSLPFDSENVHELLGMHLYGDVPDLAESGRGDLNEEVAAVVHRALAKEPAMRQPSALHLAEELEAASGVRGNLFSRVISKATGLLPLAPPVIYQTTPPPAGEAALPTVLPEATDRGKGVFNPIVLALMAEAFLSRLSSGMIKTAVPLYALLVFGMKITSVMALVLIQNVVPLLLRPVFGSMADKYGKKKVFMISLTIRTLVSVLYAVATLPLLFAISFIRGVADSAKGPSASAMIADHTDEKNIAQAYSWYTTTKSTSGGIGEALAAFVLTLLIALYAGTETTQVNIAVTDKLSKSGANAEEIVKDPSVVSVGSPIPGTESDPQAPKVIRVEQREMRLGSVPIEDLPKVVDAAPLRKSLVTIFLVSTALSLASLVLVAVFIKDKKKEKKDKKEKKAAMTGQLDEPQEQPNVWAFALLGTALTAPAYMVTGEFFTILAVKLEVTPFALGWIKILAETVIPLLFGPFFGWLADRIGAGKVIALRSVANLATSALFWIVPWFAGTWLLGVVMGAARAVDEIGKAAFKPTWGAIAAKVSSYNLASRGKTMGILEGGVDTSDLVFPVIAGAMLQYLSLGPLMLVRAMLAIVAEIYGFFLMRKYKI